MTDPTPDFEKLREEIADIVCDEIDALHYGNISSHDLADRILALPAIAGVLRMKPIQTMPTR